MHRSKQRSAARSVRAGLLAVTALGIVACGGNDEQVQASGGSMAAPSEHDAVDVDHGGGVNRPPRIESLTLSPSRPVAGEKLRASAVARDPDGDPVELAYEWKVNGRPVRGSGPEIVLGQLERRDRVSVTVTASDGHEVSEPKVATAGMGNRPPRIVDLVVHTRGSTDGVGGEWLVEPVADDPDGDMLEFEYEWRKGNRVVGEEQSLSRAGWNRGDELTVTVIARDRDDESAPVQSLPIVIGNSAPDIVSKPPGLDRSGEFRYQVEATDPDGDRGLRYALGEAPEGMEVDPFDGLVTWHASADDEGEHKVEVIVDDRNGSTTKQVFFLKVSVASGASPASID